MDLIGFCNDRSKLSIWLVLSVMSSPKWIKGTKYWKRLDIKKDDDCWFWQRLCTVGLSSAIHYDEQVFHCLPLTFCCRRQVEIYCLEVNSWCEDQNVVTATIQFDSLSIDIKGYHHSSQDRPDFV